MRKAGWIFFALSAFWIYTNFSLSVLCIIRSPSLERHQIRVFWNSFTYPSSLTSPEPFLLNFFRFLSLDLVQKTLSGTLQHSLFLSVQTFLSSTLRKPEVSLIFSPESMKSSLFIISQESCLFTLSTLSSPYPLSRVPPGGFSKISTKHSWISADSGLC